ncbi:MAG: hypothetical protein A2297_01885 [Elusimicrobia bacterium RIFOXYB2_FULL_48_7]|nr:MAG: hypothetical protein A2297_01885 [Elusimicrobia bacterium RIFOXYB2_FULL_48_7]
MYPELTGIRPVLFNIAGYGVSSYSFFVALGIVAAVIVFIKGSKNLGDSSNSVVIIASALIGGALGAKLPIWILNYKAIIASFPDMGPVLSGRTIVGGLVGGALSVYFVKKKLDIKQRRGNDFAPAIALGIAVGRIGCFLKGCCYGIPTGLPLGVNFGDDVLRHPTQLYESLFMFGVFIYLIIVKNRFLPGKLFSRFMILYFSFRFFEEFIRAGSKFYFGLTGYQFMAVLVVIFYIMKETIFNRQKEADYGRTQI